MLTNLKSIKISLLAITLAGLSYTKADAQILQTERWESIIRPGLSGNDFNVVSAQTDGLIIYDQVIYNAKGYVEISLLDTALREIWKGAISIESNYIVCKAIVHDGVAFLLCKDNLKAEFILIVVDIKTKNYRIHTINNFISFNPTEFIALGETVMIGGTFNYRPLVLHYSVLTQKSKVLPGFLNEKGELLQLKASENGIVDVIVSAKNNERKKCLWLRNYDSEGNLLKTTIVEPDPDKNLIFGRSIKASGDEQVVAGVYGRSAEYSRGIFVARINSYGEYNIKYYNFSDLAHFFNFMKASREKRLKGRIERRKIKGKKIRFNYQLLVQELIPYGDEYIMLGEAFFAHYRQANSVDDYLRKDIYFRGSSIYDGYQYTHAIVIGFSKTGKLLWDNSFEINDVRSFNLEQFVKIQPGANHINLLYLYNNTIRSKIIKDSEVLEGKTSENIKTNSPNDLAVVGYKDKDKNKLEYWYPGYFYAYGSQTLTQKNETGKMVTKRVFYINKITNQ